MKRFLALAGAMLVCVGLSGCAGDPRADAINGVLELMRAATTDIKNIKDEVKKVVDKHEKEKAPLDFTEAMKMCERLDRTGEQAQKLKVRSVDLVKPADEDEKKALADDYKGKINVAFTDLVKAKTELNAELQKAQAIDPDKTDELRSKIREAEGRFETLARQQG
jgi:hypothetical protein